MPKLTLEQIKDIVWVHNYLNSLPPEWKPYYEWWIWEVSHGTIRVKDKFSAGQGEEMIDPSEIPDGHIQNWNDVTNEWEISLGSSFGGKFITSTRTARYNKKVPNNRRIMIHNDNVRPDEDNVITPEEEVEAMHEDLRKDVPDAEEAAELSQRAAEKRVEDERNRKEENA